MIRLLEGCDGMPTISILKNHSEVILAHTIPYVILHGSDILTFAVHTECQ